MLFRLWDNKENKWYSGRYNGSKKTGKVFSAVHSAKQSLKGHYGSPFLIPYPETKQEQDQWRVELRKHNKDKWDSWEKNKHKSIQELFNGRFEIKELS